MMAPNPSLAQTQSYGLRSLWIGLWERLRELYAVLRPCRFSLFVIAAGDAFLLLTPQGSDDALRAIGIGVLFYVGLVLRRWAADRLISRTGSKRVRDLLVGELSAYSRLRDLPRLSMSVLLGSFGLAIACTTFVILDPVSFGWLFGAAAVPFLGFALIVPVGSLTVYLCHVAVARGRPQSDRSLPALTILVAWAVVGNMLADNHAVRVIPNSQPVQTQFATAVSRWHAAAKQAYERDDPPLIIVSAAGGGLRAAYWTATVLGALQDQDPHFGKSVFAISGVSGGSLGAAVFVTLLAEPHEHLEKFNACPAPERRHECIANAVLAQDFLAPAVAGLLFPDLIHKFVPVISDGHDRAAALEKGWERAWQEAGFWEKTWKDRSFTSLWNGTNVPLPALLLHGVHVATGNRIVTSNLRVSDIPLADTYAVFHDMLEIDIPLSTAVHNSARFTYVSPAGTLRQGGTGAVRGRVVDGGYFENFGAATALETLNAVSYELKATNKNFRRFIIQISNEPEVEEFAPEAEPAIAASPHET